MTVRWIRTARATSAKIPQAIGWAKEISAFIQKKHDIDVKVAMATSGETGILRWEAEYENMGVIEEKFTALLMDSEYWALIEKAFADDLFQDGTAQDTIWKDL